MRIRSVNGKYLRSVSARIWNYLFSDAQRLGLIILFMVPIVAIPHDPLSSKVIRAGLIVSYFLYIIIDPHLRQKVIATFRGYPRHIRYATITLLAMMIISSVASHRGYGIVFIGRVTDQQGLFVWLAYVVIGLFCAPAFNEKFLRSKLVFYSVLAACLYSILINIDQILLEYRPGGVFFRSTDSAIWAALLLLLAISRPVSAKVIVAYLTAALVLILERSRIAMILALVFVVASGVKRGLTRTNKLLIALLVVTAGVVIALPGYFLRFDPQIFVRGVTYRAELYWFASGKLVQHTPIWGVGAAALDHVLNSAPAPGAIADTLQSGFQFWYAHTIVLDIGLLFGGVAMIAVVVLLLSSLRALLTRAKQPPRLVYIGTYSLLLGNALVNTPSLELTGLLFVALYSSYWLPVAHAKEIPHSRKT